MFRQKYWIIVFCLLLTACGPHYKMVAVQTPPKTEQGLACLKQCNQTKTTCQKLCDIEAGDCGCEQDYQACFQLCGGVITTEKQCVSNCKE